MITLKIIPFVSLLSVCLAQVTLMAAPPPPIDLNVKTVSEDSIRGRLVTLTQKEGLYLDELSGERRHIPLDDLVRFTTTASPKTLSITKRYMEFRMRNGDRIGGVVSKGDENSVLVNTIDLGGIRLPMEDINRIYLLTTSKPTDRAVLNWFDRTDHSKEDMILLSNGDVISGFITTLEPDGINIESAMGETKVINRLIVAVRFTAAPAKEITGQHLVVTFTNSGRFTFSDLQLTGRSGKATLITGQKITLETERIARVDMIGGRWHWLASSTPISQQHTPMLSLNFEAQNNLNVLGEPIIVLGKTYEHGIGVHSRSSLIYDLQGKYKKFVTHFGLDDHSGPYADVNVVIRVDDKPQFIEEGVRPGKLYGPVLLDVTKARRIELFVDFGENGDLQDRFNWVEPALIR